jgi:hypothetical protein
MLSFTFVGDGLRDALDPRTLDAARSAGSERPPMDSPAGSVEPRQEKAAA